MGIIQADIGKGKTLLMAILARSMPYGIKKVGFVSNVPDCELLSYSDINFQEKVPRKDTFRIPKYFFLDETNYYIDGVNVAANRLYHEG
ncbi:5648_t:CDS:1, partial [Cetraspora pellucida]